MTNPNEAAYGHGAENGHCCGLSKREEFAKAAMWAAYQFAHDADQGNRFIDPKDLAQSCVAYADALIAALNKASEGRDAK